MLSPIPSEAPIVRLGVGGWGQAGGMSQRPNVLRGGEAEGRLEGPGHGTPGSSLPPCPGPMWLAGKKAFQEVGQLSGHLLHLPVLC